MSFDIETFYRLILSGFVTVWAFRRFSAHPKAKQSDFEYLGLSAFWGLVVLLLLAWIERETPERINDLFANPFATGVVFSALGASIGFLGSSLFHRTNPLNRLYCFCGDKLNKWLDGRKRIRKSRRR
jgi:hypothetical protein